MVHDINDMWYINKGKEKSNVDKTLVLGNKTAFKKEVWGEDGKLKRWTTNNINTFMEAEELML